MKKIFSSFKKRRGALQGILRVLCAWGCFVLSQYGTFLGPGGVALAHKAPVPRANGGEAKAIKAERSAASKGLAAEAKAIKAERSAASKGLAAEAELSRSLTPLGPKSDRVYPGSYHEVWQSIIENLAADVEIMKLVKKNSGIIYFERDLDSDIVWRYVNISGWDKGMTEWEKFRVKINLFVQPVSPEATKVVVNVQIRGWVAYHDYRFTVLKSNGDMEEEYLNTIQYALSEPAVVSPSSPKG